MRVEFTLSMPNVASWDGRWSGEGKYYSRIRKLSKEALVFLGLDKKDSENWFHRWSDGWRASVRARIMQKGERPKKSAGFCGYEWMIDNILRYGRTEACTQDDPHVWDDPDNRGFCKCKKNGCSTSKKLPNTKEATT